MLLWGSLLNWVELIEREKKMSEKNLDYHFYFWLHTLLTSSPSTLGMHFFFRGNKIAQEKNYFWQANNGLS